MSIPSCCCKSSYCASSVENNTFWKEYKMLKFKLELETGELRSSLSFLRLQLQNDEAPGIMKGDVAFLCQAPNDCVKPQLLHAHKFILASRSPVFRKMFEVNMLESEARVVRIDDATVDVMRAVIGFCYTAEIKFTSNGAKPGAKRMYGPTCEAVLEVAHKYGIDPLVKKCEETLIKTIDNDTLPTLLKFARKFGAKLLHAAALEYLKTHYEDVIVPVLDHLC